MRTVLVTGGAGFIGSHAVLALDEAGYNTVALDNLSNGHRDAVLAGTFVEANIRDRAALDAVFSRFDVDAVLHFAGCIEVGESVVGPLKFYNNNVCGSVSLLQSMATHGVDKIIFSSTAAVYGEPAYLPIDENHPVAPINPYGRTKLAVEAMLADAAAVTGIRAMVLRYFNAAGADPLGRLGERHQPETHLIPLVLEAAAGKRPEIAIFGTDYDTRDGSCLRDYVHVTDLVDAHLLALGKLEAGAEGATYNLGSGDGYTVREVVEAARVVTGRAITTREAPRRDGDPAGLVAGNAAVVAELGWQPNFRGLETMIEHAWIYLQSEQHP